ncbi:hypothetical protein [Desulfobotulus sp.]|uniref:hypothetical protein n=1 Tax=Desulfobotulus sp. TaxID=1940337 RepID=UPI002A364482|nr:hypothetical protein [Desulfobotulus sp.]MDY0164424.1 hypothetical protein [Desulfobotulus sp.]
MNENSIVVLGESGQVTMHCPVCERKRVVQFGPDYIGDEDFRAAAAVQPWNVTCPECEAVLWPFFEGQVPGCWPDVAMSLQLNDNPELLDLARRAAGVGGGIGFHVCHGRGQRTVIGISGITISVDTISEITISGNF